MSQKITEQVIEILACPNCVDTLVASERGAKCVGCNTNYSISESGALDLRLQRPKNIQYELELGSKLLPTSGFRFDRLRVNSNPNVDFGSCVIPHHLSKEIVSYFPSARENGDLMLDLGCGSALHKGICEHAGFEYVGLDYNSLDAPILGDAHALPFKDQSFSFILTIAVLEHIRFPFIMMKEAHRVLKTNGIIIGTVAFLEPFHDNSFYHHTHLGTYNSLREGGFDIEFIAPSHKWSALVAQACMGLFPRMPYFLAKALVMPLFLMHRIWWKIGGLTRSGASEEIRIVNTTGAFTFLARKRAD